MEKSIIVAMLDISKVGESFKGSIPDAMGVLARLRTFLANGCVLSGHLPDAVALLDRA